MSKTIVLQFKDKKITCDSCASKTFQELEFLNLDHLSFQPQVLDFMFLLLLNKTEFTHELGLSWLKQGFPLDQVYEASRYFQLDPVCASIDDFLFTGIETAFQALSSFFITQKQKVNGLLRFLFSHSDAYLNMVLYQLPIQVLIGLVSIEFHQRTNEQKSQLLVHCVQQLYHHSHSYEADQLKSELVAYYHTKTFDELQRTTQKKLKLIHLQQEIKEPLFFSKQFVFCNHLQVSQILNFRILNFDFHVILKDSTKVAKSIECAMYHYACFQDLIPEYDLVLLKEDFTLLKRLRARGHVEEYRQKLLMHRTGHQAFGWGSHAFVKRSELQDGSIYILTIRFLGFQPR